MKHVWLLFALLTVLTPVRAGIRIVGSDLLGPEFFRALQEFARRNELNLTLELTGSRAGSTELKAGRADVGLLFLAPGEAPPAAPFQSLPLAYQTVVVLVPATNPLTQVTFHQLAGVFGGGQQAAARRWGEFGLTGDWQDRGLAPQAVAEGTALSTALFRHSVLNDGPLDPVVTLHESTAALAGKLSATNGGIGLSPALPPAATGLKILFMARGDRDVACAPTPQNLHTGEYPLRLPLWLVFRQDAAKSLFSLLRYLHSDEVASGFERAWLVPLPLAARNQQVFELEQL